MKVKLLRISEMAKILFESGKAVSINSARINLYNKIRYGLGHEIKEGKIYSSFEWLKKYDAEVRAGRPAKNRFKI